MQPYEIVKEKADREWDWIYTNTELVCASRIQALKAIRFLKQHSRVRRSVGLKRKNTSKGGK